jgi:hypothetical protein
MSLVMSSAVVQVLTPSDIPAAQWTLFIVQLFGLIALVVYVWKTWEIARATRDAAVASASTLQEMRDARNAASAPHVVIYLSSETTAFAEIVVENFGDGTATQVMCRFNPPLRSTLGRDAGKFFETPKSLPPRSRLVHAFDGWTQYLASDLPRSYTVELAYCDISGTQSFTSSHVLDVTAFEHMSQWERRDIHDLATATVKLKDVLDGHLKKWRTGKRPGIAALIRSSYPPRRMRPLRRSSLRGGSTMQPKRRHRYSHTEARCFPQ